MKGNHAPLTAIIFIPETASMSPSPPDSEKRRPDLNVPNLLASHYCAEGSDGTDFPLKGEHATDPPAKLSTREINDIISGCDANNHEADSPVPLSSSPSLACVCFYSFPILSAVCFECQKLTSFSFPSPSHFLSDHLCNRKECVLVYVLRPVAGDPAPPQRLLQRG